MSKDPKHPDTGDLFIDARQLAVTDLTPGQIKKTTKLRPGALTALQRVLQLKPEQLDAAGISPAEITRAAALLSEYEYADELLAPTDKLAELVRETKLDRGHQIGNLLTEVAAQVRRRAERQLLSEEVLASLEDLLDYQYGPAEKGQLTRAKKTKPAQPATPTHG